MSLSMTIAIEIFIKYRCHGQRHLIKIPIVVIYDSGICHFLILCGLIIGLVTSQATRARSGSTRKKLGSGSARELNEPILSLNLDLINLGLGSKKARLGLSS